MSGRLLTSIFNWLVSNDMQHDEKLYQKPDPWGYQTNPEDARRKEIILKHVSDLEQPFYRALDIGAGEGWITKDLGAEIIHALEESDSAAGRFPENVLRIEKPEGFYDLIIATGVMYPHYDWRKFIDIIMMHANGYVLLCNLKNVEVPEVARIPNQILETEFSYRNTVEKLRIYDFTTQHRQKIERELQHERGNPGLLRPAFV